ncbi:MAG: aldose 1-epimerase family protein [Bacteroidia bacterium]
MIELISDSVKICFSTKGAEITSAIKDGLEYIWQADKNIWPRHAPVLFPIVGKLKNNQYFLNDKPFSLSQHGFARDAKFKVIENSATHVIFELETNKSNFENYPFEFLLRIAYVLKDDELTCLYEITNKSSEQLYFSIGAHPGFNVPLNENLEKFEDYFLEFELDKLKLSLLTDGLRNGKQVEVLLKKRRLDLNHSLFNSDALIMEGNQINKLKLFSSKSNKGVEICCLDWPYFGVWSKKGNSNFVCLEPWYGIADSVDTTGELKDKEGIILLNVEEKFNCEYSIKFY